MRTTATRWAPLIGLALALPCSASSGPSGVLPPGAQSVESGRARDTVLIRADKAYLRPGDVRTDVSILVQDGVITAVGPGLTAPEGARELSGRVVCPAFCDPWAAFGVDPGALGDNRTGADVRTTDALDPYVDPRLRRELLGSGVALLRVQAGADSSLGGIGAFVRNDPTGTASELGETVLLEDCCVSAALGVSRGGRGSDPFDRLSEVDRLVDKIGDGEKYRLDQIEYRHELEAWEKATAEKAKELEDGFKKAKKDREKDQKEAEEKEKEFKEKRYKEDRKPRPPRFDAEKEVLARVADGELPLIVEVHRAAELRALLDGTERFDRLRLVLAGATEAVAVAADLAERKIPVIVRPAPLGEPLPSEYRSHDLALAGRLANAGVQVLLGSGGRTPQASRDLPLYAALAVGHGLGRERALEALTIGAARALDVGDRVGTLEVGKQADLLVLDGEPLETATRVRFVVLGGNVVLTPEDR